MKSKSSLRRRFLPTGVVLALLPSCYALCPYNADQFVETQIRAECHFWFSCCTVGEHQTALAANGGLPDMSSFRDEGHCVEERLEEGSPLNELARAITQAEQAGRFKFDPAAFQTCFGPRIDALNNCDADFVLGDAAPVEVPESCEGTPGTGLVADRGDCFFAFECAVPGSDCLPGAVLEEADPDPEEPTEIVITRPTICIAPLKDGDDCSIDPDLPLAPTTCDPGLICFTDVQGDGDQACQPPQEDGDDCTFDNDCEARLFCNSAENPPECTALRGEGDDCNNDGECEVGLECDLDEAVPECAAPLKVEVEICNSVQGAADPTYPSK